MTPPPSPPGWYPDPWGLAPHRWWDGSNWTGATSQPPPPPPMPARAAGAAPPSPALQHWARAAVVVYPALQVVTAVTYASSAQELRRDLRAYVDAVRATANEPGAPAPVLHMPTALNAVSPLGLIALGALVVGLVWQYRAATAARAAGRPAAHGPGFGVGSWFIPVVNLWMPYQALRDLLPPGHPGRPRLLVAWLLALAALLLTPSGLVVAFFSGSAAAAVLVAAGICWLTVGVLAWRHLDAVTASFRQAHADQGGWQASQA